MAPDTLVIEEWAEAHPRWGELMAVVEAEGQLRWVQTRLDFHRGAHMLVARCGEDVVGFLRFVTQEIGADEERPSVALDGVALMEAKVLAFGVVESQRRRGIGRALQEAALARARTLGCYQMRSHSSGSNRANHRLKLSMGFAVHPIVRGADDRGVYFIMPLAAAARSGSE